MREKWESSRELRFISVTVPMLPSMATASSCAERPSAMNDHKYRYIYLGTRKPIPTDPRFVGQACDPVLDARGKCIVGRGAALIVFFWGEKVVVVRRRLRLVSKLLPDADPRMNPRRFYCRYKDTHKIVWVDVVRFDLEWRKDDAWIPPLPPCEHWHRTERFNDWRKPFEVGIVYVNCPPLLRGETVSFEDGRHRFVLMRDLGLNPIPVGMDAEAIANAKQLGLVMASPRRRKDSNG